MPTTTRARRSPAAGQRRFSRSGTTPSTRRFSGPAMNARRHAAPQRRGIAGGWLQRRQPKQSTLQRMMGGMSSAKPGRKGAGGLAALAGAAGLAFKNRDRLASMMRRKNDAPQV